MLNVSIWVIIAAMMLFVDSTVLAEDYRQAYFPVKNCINMGDDLDSPPDPLTGGSSWGFTIKEKYFSMVRAKGFDTVRIPIRWSSGRSLAQAPYTIDPVFLGHVDQVVDWAIRAGLNVIIDVHHFDELFKNPDREEPRLVAIWKQLGEHYRKKPPRLMFEIINEPQGAFQGERLNRIQLAALSAIRKTNPTRTVILTGDEGGGVTGIYNLRLPSNDHHVVASVHSYTPLAFTHQGFDIKDPYNPENPIGRTYPQPGDISLLNSEMDVLIDWRNRLGIPVFMGEYGSIDINGLVEQRPKLTELMLSAHLASRGCYTRDLTNNLKRAQMPGCLWAFGGLFGAYDTKKNQWHTPIVEGLQLNVEDIIIDDDVYRPEVANWSKDTVVARAKQQVKQGVSALAVTYQAPEAILSWRLAKPQSTAGYSALRFWVYGGVGNGKLRVYTQPTDNGPASTGNFEFTSTPGAWREIVVPLRALGNPTQFARLNLQDTTGRKQPTFYIDQVRLSQTGSATPPSDVLIHDDILGAWLADASWEGVTTTPDTTLVKSGASALAVQFSSWGQELAWQRKSHPVSLRPYSALRFWVYGTPSTGTLRVSIHQQSAEIDGNAIIPPIRTVDFTPTPGVWREIAIPLKDLGSPANFFRLTFKGVTQGTVPPKFYLDQVRITP